ncbi:MAG: DUF3560 domain-containing protein [Armatimonadia bacterium]|nr:DUF3560 domain-containing protein [Armatimonadia bacterium]
MPREDYEERKQARIERYEARAEKARQDSQDAWEAERAIGDRIPFGQPILVGHHSEKSHRADIKRIQRLADKGLEEAKKAEHYDQRAKAARANRAISSDDPEAIQKLEARLEATKTEHERQKEVNALLRKLKKEPQEAQVVALVEMGCPEGQAWTLTTPDFMGRIGFTFLANSRARIKRIEERIEELRAAEESAETVERTIGDAEVVENVDENRLQIFFPGKPPEETRRALRQNGFRWAPSVGAWQRQLNNAARYAAEYVLKGSE